MAKNRKRADGRYVKRVTYGSIKVDVYAKSQKELEEKAFQKLQELKENKQNHDNPTVKLFYERWVENRRGSVKEATIRSQQCHFNTVSTIVICGKQFGSYRLSEVTADDIRCIQKHLVDNGNSTQTTNDKINFISHLFNDALKERYITYNPCVCVKPLKKTEKMARDTVHRALSVEETRLFFENAQSSFYYDVLRFALNTGMRIGEIGALKNSDIYDGMIHINRTITRNEDGSYRIGEDGKTKHAKRTIPLNASIIEIIEHQREINSLLDGNISNINDTIFKAPQRGLLMATPIDREIKRICKRIGMDAFTAHGLRSTFATRCIEQGIEPRTLQELLGHADFSLTMNLYGHVLDDTKEKAMSKLRIVI